MDAETLARVPLFAGMSIAGRESLAPRFRRRHFRKGQVLFLVGDHDTSLVIVESGFIKIGLTSPEGKEIAIELFRPGAFFGEVEIVDGQPRAADAIALEPSIVQILGRDDFLNCLEAEPREGLQVMLLLSQTLSQRVRRNGKVLSGVAFDFIQVRLASVLVDLTADRPAPVDIGPYTHASLASLINATRESVSNWMGVFAKQKLLHREGKRLIIDQPDKLRRYASGTLGRY